MMTAISRATADVAADADIIEHSQNRLLPPILLFTFSRGAISGSGIQSR